MNKTNNKTIAIFVNTSWNIYNFRLQLMKRLQREGYRVVAIAPVDSYSKLIEESGFEYQSININNMGTNPREDFRLTGDILKLYRKIRPDLLLHFTIKPNIYGSIAAKFSGIPTISNITGLGTVFLSDSLSCKLAKRLYRIALRIPRKVFFQNPHDLEHFVNKKLVAVEKTELLPGSGIDPQHYQPVPNGNGKDHPFVFLLIARMLKDKGIVEFVDAAKSLLQRQRERQAAQRNGVEFWLLGSLYPGNPTAISQQEIDTWTHEKNINYLGYTDDVMSVIARSDCVVLPSYREGISRVLLEAASMAKPLITTDVPGCSDVVDDGVNGYLCKVKDVSCLTEQMEKMLCLTGEEREAMGNAGRQKVIEEYSEHLVIDKYLAAIREILGEV